MRLAVLVVAQVLGVANANMIAVALPPLSRDLGATGAQQQWIVDAYVLVFASLLIAGGTLADRYGRRRAFMLGLALFAAGSLACALAGTPGAEIAARAVQGLGPPLILPASLALVAAAHPDRAERARAIGFWGAGSGLGIALGPLLGGIIVSALGWRWVFAINTPIALALVAAALLVLPRDAPAKTARAGRSFHVPMTAGMAGIVFGTIEGRERGWSSAAVLGAFAVGVLALAVVVRMRTPAWMARRVFAGANLAGALVLFSLLGTTVYVSAYLQAARGLTALETGLALLPLGGATALLAPASGRLTARVDPRALIVAGLLAGGAGAALIGRLGGALWPGLVLLGAGVGLALPAATSTAVGAAPAAETGMASAIHNASRQLGATLGVAVLGTIVLSAAGPAQGLRVAMTVAAAVLAAAALAAARLLR